MTPFVEIQPYATPDELHSYMAMATSYPNFRGRCVIQLTLDRILSIHQFYVLLHGYEKERLLKGNQRVTCINIIQSVRQLKENSDALFSQKYGYLRRFFFCCCCCSCGDSFDMAKLTKLEIRLRGPEQSADASGELASAVDMEDV